MTQIQRKLNVYFFGEANPAISDQVTYYGTLAAGGLMAVFSAVIIW